MVSGRTCLAHLRAYQSDCILRIFRPICFLPLGAIDFGIIVDGAIVMLETILKKREDHPENSLEEKSIARRAKEVGRPILFSTIVIITAYLPLFAFERVERKLFTPMAFTMSYAMIGALLVALLLIPGLAYAIYRKPRKLYKNRWLEKLKEKYTGVVAKVVDAPLKAIVPSIVFLVAGIVLSVTVGKDFLPELDEGSIWLQVNLPPGISVEKSREFSDTLRARTMKYPEVTYIMVQAGRNDDGTDPFTPSHFEVSVGIKPAPGSRAIFHSCGWQYRPRPWRPDPAWYFCRPGHCRPGSPYSTDQDRSLHSLKPLPVSFYTS